MDAHNIITRDHERDQANCWQSFEAMKVSGDKEKNSYRLKYSLVLRKA
jgi:hypothetical protein